MGTELEVLLEQLDELLASPVVDEEDALEIAIVAGSAARLGADPMAMAPAEAWRTGDGAELLASLWEAVEGEPLLEALEAAAEGTLSEEQVEEAVYDVDDLLVAAVWCKQQARVRPFARRAEAIVKELPDVFVDLAPDGRALAKRREVAEELDLYAFWLVIADLEE
jgi:hypothetical protein